MTKVIPPEHKLPCDFVVGHIRYRKGVKLETVRQAAERWLRQAASFGQPSPYDLKKMIGKITPENKHDEVQ
jgi:hypothetical protein